MTAPRFAATSAIVRFVDAYRLASSPPALQARASALVLDYCAVNLAALDHDLVPRLLGTIDVLEQGPASLSGHGFASVADAAFFNGALAHALEYDDSTLNPVGHPGAVILPALFALGEQQASGAQLLQAWMVGLEVHSRLGQAQRGNWSFTGGWLPIGHISLMGAAMACAKLLQLTPVQIGHALGLAAHCCGQLSVNAGSQAKPVGAGHAARCGVLAARLAGQGVESSADIIEREGGFADTFFGTGFHDLSVLQHLGAPLHLEEIGVAIKRYPSCYGCHWGVDALLDLIGQHGLTVDNVRDIKLAHPPSAAFLDNAAPGNEEEAKFSHEYNLAVTLLRGIPRVHDFSPAMIGSAALQAVLGRVRTEIHPDDAPVAVARSYRVTVTMTDGQTLSHAVARPLGHPRRPMSAADLEDKFHHCVQHALRDAEASQLRVRVEALARAPDLHGITRLLRGAGR